MQMKTFSGPVIYPCSNQEHYQTTSCVPLTDEIIRLHSSNRLSGVVFFPSNSWHYHSLSVSFTPQTDEIPNLVLYNSHANINVIKRRHDSCRDRRAAQRRRELLRTSFSQGFHPTAHQLTAVVPGTDMQTQW